MTSGKLRLSFLSSAATIGLLAADHSSPLLQVRQPCDSLKQPLLQSTCQLSLLELLVVKALPPN